jgi:hypothetical protein
LFNDLNKLDPKFTDMWSRVPKFSSKVFRGKHGPHFFANYGQICDGPLTDDIKEKIDARDIPMYKLTRKGRSLVGLPKIDYLLNSLTDDRLLVN